MSTMVQVGLFTGEPVPARWVKVKPGYHCERCLRWVARKPKGTCRCEVQVKTKELKQAREDYADGWRAGCGATLPSSSWWGKHYRAGYDAARGLEHKAQPDAAEAMASRYEP